MEDGRISDREALVNQLVQGMELAKRLRDELIAITPAQDKELSLVEGILSSYHRALSALQWREPTIRCPPPITVVSSLPPSPVSIDGSPQSEDFDMSFDDHNDLNKSSKKRCRKSLPRWTKQVRVSSETGLEGSCEDGHSWRKYGQKDILGAKYPRSYYRCTFRNSQDCWATKQVQRSDKDSSVFEITYRGKHTCSHGNHMIPPLMSSEKQQERQINHSNDIDLELQSQKTTSAFLCPSTLLGWTESKNRDVSQATMDNNTLPESISPMPESSYLMQFPYPGSEEFQRLQQSETNITETILSEQFSDYFTNSEFGFLSPFG